METLFAEFLPMAAIFNEDASINGILLMGIKVEKQRPRITNLTAEGSPKLERV
jgi:hypothetical protein